MSNRRRVLAAVAVVVVVAGVVATFIGYQAAHQPKGAAPTGLVPAPSCQLSQSTLARTNTHNPTYSNESQSGDQHDVGCVWGQTTGIDGVNPRTLRFGIHRYTGPAAEQGAKDGFQAHKAMPHGVQPAQVTDATGIGDEAAYQTSVQSSGTATVALIVRKGTMVVEVTYEGADQGFLWTTPMSFSEGEGVTRLVADGLLGS